MLEEVEEKGVIFLDTDSALQQYPELVKEWDYEKNKTLVNKRDNKILTPHSVSPGSHQEVFWKCSKGHQWAARIANRTYLGNGCPICSGQKILPGYLLKSGQKTAKSNLSNRKSKTKAK